MAHRAKNRPDCSACKPLSLFLVPSNKLAIFRISVKFELSEVKIFQKLKTSVEYVSSCSLRKMLARLQVVKCLVLESPALGALSLSEMMPRSSGVQCISFNNLTVLRFQSLFYSTCARDVMRTVLSDVGIKVSGDAPRGK